MLTLGSLFSGIGGLDLGLERAGMRVIWQSEIEPFCCKVLAHHWPGIPNHGDITQIDWTQVERPDVLCGGFPCQDISASGRKAGIVEGTRSGLWSYYAEAIRILRPRYAIIENVAALFIRGLEIVLTDLVACGYDAEWRMLRACDFGAPHRRKRVFIVAYSREVGPPRVRTQQLFSEGHPEKSSAWRTEITNRDITAYGSTYIGIPNNLCMDNGFPVDLDSIAAYGNAVVPQVAEYVGRCVVDHAANCDKSHTD